MTDNVPNFLPEKVGKEKKVHPSYNREFFST